MKFKKSARLGMGSFSIFAAASMLAGASSVLAGPSLPQPVPFAAFLNGNFALTDSGTGVSLAAQVTPPLQVTFEFYEPVSYNSPGFGGLLSYAALQPITATMAITATSTTTPTGTPQLDQTISNGTWSFTNQYGDNLLTVSSFNGDLVGLIGGATDKLSIDTTASPADALVFSSNFLNFSPDYAGIASTALTLEPGTNVATGTGGFQNSFTANGDGTFSDTPVPEPTALGLIVASGFMLLGRRRRA